MTPCVGHIVRRRRRVPGHPAEGGAGEEHEGAILLLLQLLLLLLLICCCPAYRGAAAGLLELALGPGVAHWRGLLVMASLPLAAAAVLPSLVLPPDAVHNAYSVKTLILRRN
jgi:hypothetical protein